MAIISRGFKGKRRGEAEAGRLPAGQYLVEDFPVLSAGPTPLTSLDQWSFTLNGEIDEPRTWTWDEFNHLQMETINCDIHCVTKWSKLDTVWEGVSIETILDGVDTAADFALAFCDGGYTTNVPLEDLMGGKAWIAIKYEGEPLPAAHGGHARLLVPHLYFWKSAKWVRGLTLKNEDEPGFWEGAGYHIYGDPWREQRYYND